MKTRTQYHKEKLENRKKEVERKKEEEKIKNMIKKGIIPGNMKIE